MEKEMLRYANRLKALLRNEEELGERDLLDEVQLLHEDYERDSESRLACQLDFGLGFYDKECPFSEDELGGIQKSITVFMARRAKEDPLESDPELAETREFPSLLKV